MSGVCFWTLLFIEAIFQNKVEIIKVSVLACCHGYGIPTSISNFKNLPNSELWAVIGISPQAGL